MENKTLATTILLSILTLAIFILSAIITFTGATLMIRILSFICCISLTAACTMIVILVMSLINDTEDN